jgi:predicted ATP-grasp superfamily ATP-dependent carboligase
MSKTVLLTLGRLPKALDFARAFKGARWRVLVAEPSKTHLTGVSRSVAASFVVPPPIAGKQAYLAALVKIVEDQNVDLVLPLSEESMHVAPLADLVPSHVRVYAPPQMDLLALHDKARFIEMAASFDLPVPQTAKLGSDNAISLAAKHDYVIKPVYSCSGRGVGLHQAGTPLPPAAMGINEQAIVQEQLKGEQVSTFGIAHKGKVVVNVVYRGTIMSGSVAVAFERIPQLAVDKWVGDFVAATGHSGFISFDFFIDANGTPRAIECNPRVTSGVHFIETGLVDALLDPENAAPTFRALKPHMQFFAALTEVQGGMFKPGFGAKFKAMLASADVCWRLDDPLPLLTMPATSFPMLMKSMQSKKSFGEVFTDDIVWFEGEVLGAAPLHNRAVHD